MSDIAIDVDRLSSHYRPGTGPLGRGDFRDAAGAVVSRGVQGSDADDDEGSDSRDPRALRDVSFQIRTGEVVGIIGHNGRGARGGRCRLQRKCMATLQEVAHPLRLPSFGELREHPVGRARGA